jgi:hypothetical protein
MYIIIHASLYIYIFRRKKTKKSKKEIRRRGKNAIKTTKLLNQRNPNNLCNIHSLLQIKNKIINDYEKDDETNIITSEINIRNFTQQFHKINFQNRKNFSDFIYIYIY